MHSRIESGVELLTRLLEPPSLDNLRDQILLEGIQANDAIEISGEKSTGKTLLLYELIGKCILPKCHNDLEVGGCDASAILINSDQKFCATKFMEVTRNLASRECIRNLGNITEDANATIKTLVRDSLKKLIVIDCCDYEQFLITTNLLTDILLGNRKIALVAVDSITAHYWRRRQIYGVTSVNFYTKQCLKLVRTSTSRCKVPTIYTRLRDAPEDSKTSRSFPQVEPKSLDTPTHIIHLQKPDAAGAPFSCTLHQLQGLERKCTYLINETGISWNEEREEIEEKDQGNQMKQP